MADAAERLFVTPQALSMAIKKMENELDEINARLLTESDKALIEKQAQLTENFQNEGGLTFHATLLPLRSCSAISRQFPSESVSSAVKV